MKWIKNDEVKKNKTEVQIDYNCTCTVKLDGSNTIIADKSTCLR